MKNEFLKKIQDNGLAILELHEKLNELKIDHEFFNRKEEMLKGIKEKKAIDAINDVCPFDYQIFIEENGNRMSLIQNGFSYGITENLIEVYDFNHEPVVLDHKMAAVLIQKKKLNNYIIACYEKNVEELEKIKEVLKLLIERED